MSLLEVRCQLHTAQTQVCETSDIMSCRAFLTCAGSCSSVEPDFFCTALDVSLQETQVARVHRERGGSLVFPAALLSFCLQRIER